MKKKVELIIGIIALLNVIYKMIVCLTCDDRIFFFEVSWIVYILFWISIAVATFYEVYKANWGGIKK